MDAVSNEGARRESDGRGTRPPCRHVIQNPAPAHPPHGIGERHILHLSEEVPGHLLGIPRSLRIRTSEKSQNANFAVTEFSEVGRDGLVTVSPFWRLNHWLVLPWRVTKRLGYRS